MEDSYLFFEGLKGGLRSKIELPRLEGLNLLAEAGEGLVVVLDTIDAVIKAFELGLEAL